MTIADVTRLTPEQDAALSAFECSVSLAAGAGCGKTFVLTERFLAHLDPQGAAPRADLDQLVAITFTDAAAREMRQRIRDRAYQRFEAAIDPDQRAHWQNIIRSLETAQISTIHSFCTTLLREHAVEVGVDPRFRVLDAAAAQLLRVQTLDDRLRELLAEGEERVIQLAARLDLRRLRDTIAELLGENIGPVVDKWHGKQPTELVDAWRQFHARVVVPLFASDLLTAEPTVELRKICASPQVTKEGLADHCQRILQTLDQLAGGDAFAVVVELRQLARVQGVCSAKDWVYPEEFERFKAAAAAVRALIDKSPLRKPLDTEPMLEAAQTGLALLDLVADIAARHAAAKRDENVLEFDDLLIRAHQLLTDPQHKALQQRLSAGAQLLMVDEFQDTDPLQVEIVTAFCGDDWQRQGLFVVGDHKQSIYRFRGARPEVSRQLREQLDAIGRLSLTTNFRSQPAITNFVNALFHGLLDEAYQPLQAHRPQQTPLPAVEFLWAVGEDPDADPTTKHGPAQRARMREARFIARRLAQLIDSQERLIVGDDGTLRPVQLNDVAILMRALSDVPTYEAALREQGLDYYLAGGHAFYAQQEIYDVLHLLRAIASSADDLSLAGVLRSPMFALADETLFWLVREHGSLNAGLFAEQLPHQLTEDQRAKAAHAAQVLDQLRAAKDRLLVTQLLNQAMDLTGFDASLLAEFLGERKLANVQKLIEQARTLENDRPGDLAGFITQLSEFVVSAPKEPLAATSAESDAIRLMTIHNAKGLEFPLVVVPDLERRSPPDTLSARFHAELGPLVPARESGQMVGLDLFRAMERREDLEERKRMLYVACTRAADYLILSSSVEDLDKPKSDWSRLLSQRFDLASGAYRAALPAGYGVPEVRVTLEEPHSDRKPVGKGRGADLAKLVADTRAAAAAGAGVVPVGVAPIAVDSRARRRFSFSRLSGALRHEVQATDDPLPTATGPGGRGLGTLVHAVLERINFRQPEDIAELCRFLAPQSVDSPWQATAEVAAQLVSSLLDSPRAAEIAQAQILRREVEFLLPWPLPPQSPSPTVPQSPSPYLHGYIDCLYQDAAGNWHLIDFKSNHVAAEGVAHAADEYALQMFVYYEACRQALGVAPVECALNFLRPQCEYQFNFGAEKASEYSSRLTQAIAAHA